MYSDSSYPTPLAVTKQQAETNETAQARVLLLLLSMAQGLGEKSQTTVARVRRVVETGQHVKHADYIRLIGIRRLQLLHAKQAKQENNTKTPT